MLQPVIGAKFLAWYFVDRSIPTMARAGNWQGVLEAVNGGLNGYEGFLWAVHQLEGVPSIPAPPAAPAHTRRKVKQTCTLKSAPSHKPPATVLVTIHANAWLEDTGTRVVAEGTTWATVHFGTKGHLYTGYLDAANLI